MKFAFLKKKKDRLPSLKSLRPPVFDVDLFWFAGLGAGFVVLLITAFVSFKLSYSQYFESYKVLKSPENYENPIDINKLERTINKRNDFINQKISLPKDPSL
jgi:hypothetical protein